VPHLPQDDEGAAAGGVAAGALAAVKPAKDPASAEPIVVAVFAYSANFVTVFLTMKGFRPKYW